MSTAEAALGQARVNVAGRLALLLAVAIFINYVDRGNLATASPLIKDELHLTNTQMGLMISAFFWIYAPGQIFAGLLADRIGPHRALTFGFILWSCATALTGFVTGFVWLVALRIVLGIGESTSFPCTSKLIAQHLPPHKLGFVNGLVGAGLSYGPAFGTLVGGLIAAQFGWRAMFVLFGTVALVWLVPWLSVTRNVPPPAHANADEAPPPFMAILAQRAAWGSTLGHFAANYVLYFILSWLPLYLVKERGFTIVEMAQIGAAVYAVSGTSAIMVGWLSDRWIASGLALNSVRKTVVICGHLGIAVSLVGCAYGSPVAAIACLIVCGIFMGFNSTSIWSITQTLAGPAAAARWVGVQNGLANIAGIVAPLITGFVVDRTGSFIGAFVTAAVVAFVGAAGWGLIIRRVELVNWANA